MEASSARKHEHGDKGRLVKYWACFGCWISPCYSLFLLGVHFETYELFNSLIFKFFSGHGKPQITEITNTVSADTGACLYIGFLTD
jgi:hypothetical protein